MRGLLFIVIIASRARSVKGALLSDHGLRMNTLTMLYAVSISGQFPVHGGRVGFGDVVRHLRDLHLQRALAEGDLDDVAFLDLVARLGLPPVDQNPVGVAGVIRHAAPLDKA